MLPIIYPGTHRFNVEVTRLRNLGLVAFVIGVPLEMLAGKDERCRMNHGLSLHGLAQSVGCTAKDALAILYDKHPVDLGNKDPAHYHYELLVEVVKFKLGLK